MAARSGDNTSSPVSGAGAVGVGCTSTADSGARLGVWAGSVVPVCV